MKSNSLDEAIGFLNNQLAALSARSMTLFYASCSERFIGLYADFAAKANWGDFQCVRNALDNAWKFLTGGVINPVNLETSLERLEECTPHIDDFDYIETTLAQDVCICVDATLRLCLGKEEFIPIVEYAFEAIRVSKCIVETGYYDLGEGAEAKTFEATLLQDERFIEEVKFQQQDINLLSAISYADNKFINNLQQLAIKNKWTVAKLLGEGFELPDLKT